MSDEEISSRTPSPETADLPGIQGRKIKTNPELQDHSILVQQTFPGRVSAVSGATPAVDPKTQSSQSAATTCDPITDFNSATISEEVKSTRPVQPLGEPNENGIATAVKTPSPQSTASDVPKTDYGQENAPILTGNGDGSTNNNCTAAPSLTEAAKIPDSSVYSIAGGTTHKGQRTNSNSTEETNARSEGEANSHVTEETLAHADEMLHSDRIGNMIRLLYPKEITHAIENLFIHSKELELQNELRDIINWCKKIMFEDPYLNLKVFYSIAMQMYRRGKETEFCPLCLKRKKDRVNNKEESPHPDSHVFSRCALEEFRRIHCEVELYEFIYNQISGEFKTSENLTWKLFCQKCETSASAEERLLRQAYLRIAGAKDNMVYMPEEDGLKVKHILAVILFRTMLLGVDILDEYNDKFWSTLRSLRELCCNANAEEYKHHPLLTDFHVFVLANQTYNNENVPFSYPVDFQLRNPQLARMVKIDNDKVFLHNKFDVFHCILTIQWSDDVIRLDPKEPFHAFPEFLWKYYLSRIGSIWQHILPLKKPCRAFLLDPLIRIATSEPLTSLELPPSVHIILTSSDDPRSALDKDNKDTLRSMARRKSSIAAMASQSDGNSSLEEKCKNLRSEKEKLQSHFTKAENKTKKFRQEFEKFRKEFEKSLIKLNAKCGELDERITQLENTTGTLKKHISRPSYQKSYKDLHPYQSDNLDSV